MKIALLGFLIFIGLSLHEPPPPMATCTQSQIDVAQLPPYTPTQIAGFAEISDGRFVIGEEAYTVRGVNYFPAWFPWRRFLTETDRESLQTEFALLRDAGMNTLRIFLWYEALFDCPGSGAVPDVENFARLDMILHEAAAHDLRLIVTLNDGPDLTIYPLYHNPHYVNLQTTMIVSRYRDEPVILAWDLRNEGDIDYGSRDGFVGQRFERDLVLRWLATTSSWVRALDNNHLITAGWLFDSLATAPYVDFLSFHHWWDVPGMQARVDEMRTATVMPILMEEVGFSTFNVSVEEQAENITGLVQAAEEANLLGWMVWTAFDFPVEATCWPSPCVDGENHEHHFGLWHSDYTPKPAAEAVMEAIAK